MENFLETEVRNYNSVSNDWEREREDVIGHGSEAIGDMLISRVSPDSFEWAHELRLANAHQPWKAWRGKAFSKMLSDKEHLLCTKVETPMTDNLSISA